MESPTFPVLLICQIMTQILFIFIYVLKLHYLGS